MRSLVIVPLLLLLFCSNAAKAVESLADLMERCEKSVIRINTSSSGGESLGSGYLVDDQGTFVTNNHVMAGALDADVIFSSGAKYKVIGTLLMDEKRDIVVGKIRADGIPGLKVSNRLPRKAETVTAIGAPLGLDFTVTNGIVSAIRASKDLGNELEGTWIQIDADIAPGNSGGPIVNAVGEVVAMSTFKIDQQSGLNFGISCVDIYQAIEKSRNMPLMPLSRGAAKVRPKRSGGGEIAVPTKAIDAYVKNGRENFDSLILELRKDYSTERTLLLEMKRGTTNLYQFVEPNDERVAARVVGQNGSVTWAFRSHNVQRLFIERQERVVDHMASAYTSTKAGFSDEALTNILCNAGKILSTRAEGSVGFARDITVVAVMPGNAAIILYESKPYIALMETTSGLFVGDKLPPTVFYVAGPKIMEFEDQYAHLTFLVEVPRKSIESAIGASSYSKPEPTPPSNSVASSPRASQPRPNAQTPTDTPSSGGFSSFFAPASDGRRTWTSHDGKFQIEAIFLSNDDTHVSLKRWDNGQVIKVPLKSLCAADQRHLAK